MVLGICSNALFWHPYRNQASNMKSSNSSAISQSPRVNTLVTRRVKSLTFTSWGNVLFVPLPKRGEKLLLQVPGLTRFLPVLNCSLALILAEIRVACHVAHQLVTDHSSGHVSVQFQQHASCRSEPHQRYAAVAVDCGRSWVCLACVPRS